MGVTSEPERVELVVPLEPVGSSGRRARLVLAIWTLALFAVAWIGLVGRDDAAPVADAPTTTARVTATAVVSSDASAVPTGTAPRGTVRSIAAPVVIRQSFGEDGLMGGIVFGDNVPSKKIQADVERDGYRRYFVP